jgi:hypothetical protein
MFQEILALIIVASAVIYLFWSIYRSITPSKDKRNTICGGCSSGGCEVKEFNKTVHQNN